MLHPYTSRLPALRAVYNPSDFSEGDHKMLKTTIAVGLAALALTGCMTAEQRQAYDESVVKLSAAIEQVRQAAQIECNDTATCEREWMLTRAYVEQNSSMRIRNADASAIDTYDPIHTGEASLYARRVPVRGGGMMISLDGVCRGMYQGDGTPGPAFASCATAIGVPQRNFRAYLQSNL